MSARRGERLQQRGRFIAGLEQSSVRLRVGNDTGGGLNRRVAILYHHSSNRDAGVEITGEAEVTDRPRVDASPFPFELGNDLHGADLLCHRYGPRWEARAQRIHRGAVGAAL